MLASMLPKLVWEGNKLWGIINITASTDRTVIKRSVSESRVSHDSLTLRGHKNSQKYWWQGHTGTRQTNARLVIVNCRAGKHFGESRQEHATLVKWVTDNLEHFKGGALYFFSENFEEGKQVWLSMAHKLLDTQWKSDLAWLCETASKPQDLIFTHRVSYNSLIYLNLVPIFKGKQAREMTYPRARANTPH